MKLAAAAAILFGAGVQIAGAADDHLPPAPPAQSSLLPAMDVATYQLLTQQRLTALQTQQAIAGVAKTQIKILRTLQQMQGHWP